MTPGDETRSGVNGSDLRELESKSSVVEKPKKDDGERKKDDEKMLADGKNSAAATKNDESGSDGSGIIATATEIETTTGTAIMIVAEDTATTKT